MVEQLISIGMIVIIVGIIIMLVGILSQVKSKQTKVEGGGIVFIGPFPVIGGATSKQIFYILLTVSVVLIIAFLLLGRKI